MTVYDLRIANADVVLPAGVTKADIIVHDGRISEILQPGVPVETTSTLDATGLHVFPGVVDPHVHLGPNITYPQSPEDAVPESQSAAAGGVTTMLAYLMTAQPYHEVYPTALETMSNHSFTDFGFHFCVVTREQIEAIPDYVSDLGVSSYKFFMNFKGDEGKYLGLPGNDDGYMYDVLGMAADNGAMINPHPENIELVWKLKNQPIDESRGPLSAWNQSRPSFVEAEAVQRVAYMAQITGASVYAVHTSSQLALEAMERQRQTYQNLFIETCTQYLTLTTEADCGTYGKVNPPIRERADLEALWVALAEGKVDSVGSDHNARHRSFKEKDVWTASAGFPGTGGVLPLTLSEGLRRGVPIERLVDATSTRAAQLFGLYPQKGTIRVGSDADLAVVDLTGSYVINAATQHSGADYTPWEGTEVPLSVVHTIVRGEFALRDGVLADRTTGRYLRREHSGAVALAAAAEVGAA